MLFLVPLLAVVLQREKNVRLRSLFILVLCAGLCASSLILLRDTARQEESAKAQGQDMMDTAQYLLDHGYTHGYGTFWHVRVMQERTQGALTFTGVTPGETEAGAVSPNALSFMRWGEMGSMSDLDICPGKTFLLLTHEEEELIAPWLTHVGAPLMYENSTYRVYGFESSQAFAVSMAEGKMTLDHAQALGNGAYLIGAGGRLRMPPDWREAGAYSLSFEAEGVPQDGSVVRIYSGRQFEVIAEQPIAAGSNRISFVLEHDDKYFMMQIHAGEAEELRVDGLALEKSQP